jgi:hypothetical protein
VEPAGRVEAQWRRTAPKRTALALFAALALTAVIAFVHPPAGTHATRAQLSAIVSTVADQPVAHVRADVPDVVISTVVAPAELPVAAGTAATSPIVSHGCADTARMRGPPVQG